jgi:hypothetical protein
VYQTVLIFFSALKKIQCSIFMEYLKVIDANKTIFFIVAIEFYICFQKTKLIIKFCDSIRWLWRKIMCFFQSTLNHFVNCLPCFSKWMNFFLQTRVFPIWNCHENDSFEISYGPMSRYFFNCCVRRKNNKKNHKNYSIRKTGRIL